MSCECKTAEAGFWDNGHWVPRVIEMCAECWEKVPHRKSFDICSKCFTQCDAFDWSEWR